MAADTAGGGGVAEKQLGAGGPIALREGRRMSYLAVNSMGLFADIIGVALVFVFGLPANVSRTGAVYI